MSTGPRTGGRWPTRSTPPACRCPGTVGDHRRPEPRPAATAGRRQQVWPTTSSNAGRVAPPAVPGQHRVMAGRRRAPARQTNRRTRLQAYHPPDGANVRRRRHTNNPRALANICWLVLYRAGAIKATKRLGRRWAAAEHPGNWPTPRRSQAHGSCRPATERLPRHQATAHPGTCHLPATTHTPPPPAMLPPVPPPVTRRICNRRV